MKPIPDAVANAMPDVHASFVEWLQSSREVQAAILQRRPDVEDMVKTSREKLDAYLAAIRARNAEHRERMYKVLWTGRTPL